MVDYSKWDKLSKQIASTEAVEAKQESNCRKERMSASGVDKMGDECKRLWKKHYGDDPLPSSELPVDESEWKRRVDVAWESRAKVKAEESRLRGEIERKVGELRKTLPKEAKQLRPVVPGVGTSTVKNAFRGYGDERLRTTRAGRKATPEEIKIGVWAAAVEIMMSATVVASIGGKNCEFGYLQRRLLFAVVGCFLLCAMWFSGSPAANHIWPLNSRAHTLATRYGFGSLFCGRTYRLSILFSQLAAAWFCCHSFDSWLRVVFTGTLGLILYMFRPKVLVHLGATALMAKTD